jgi:hypothetical protein
MTAVAQNFRQARRVLDPMPLRFDDDAKPGEASRKEFYQQPAPEVEDGVRLLSTFDSIIDDLLNGSTTTKVFLSGHVGSGKSTQLNLLARDPRILSEFTVVRLAFEEHEWAHLDAQQALFRVAEALHSHGVKNGLLTKKAWEKPLRVLSSKLFGEQGGPVREGGVGIEVNALIVKIKGDLKLNDKFRRQFREFGESEQSVLRDLIEGLVDDLSDGLSKTELPDKLLLIVDDLDKVRDPVSQQDIFDKNLDALLSPPLCAVYTLPSSIPFGSRRPELNQRAHHLFPVRVLDKAHDGIDPERHVREERLPFFQKVVNARVAGGIIDDDAVRVAAIFSGGVLRDFFYLLREGLRLAEHNEQSRLNADLMRAAVRAARRKESGGIYAKDLEVLRAVHRTNQLQDDGDRRYLDLARVLECFNGHVWFEVNPLLWELLSER